MNDAGARFEVDRAAFAFLRAALRPKDASFDAAGASLGLVRVPLPHERARFADEDASLPEKDAASLANDAPLRELEATSRRTSAPLDSLRAALLEHDAGSSAKAAPSPRWYTPQRVVRDAPMQQDDYIERLIAQVTAAIGRILGMARAGQPEEADRDLAATWSGLVGFRRTDVERVDEETLLALLGDRRVAAAMLLDAEAELKRAEGQVEAAEHAASLAARLRT